MNRLAIILCAVAAPAFADDTRIWDNPYNPTSRLQIHAPTAPHAVATVTFDNTSVHGADEEFTLTWEGITIHVDFEWNSDAQGRERVTVYAPDGYTAVPPSIEVREDQSDVIHIVQWIGG